MRMSNLFGATLRTAPNRTGAEGHQLLVRAGFVRQLGQGSFSYLPLGWRVLKKIEDILRDTLDALGGQELSMPVVHPKSREELVAELCRSEVSSYRDLPRLVYQLQERAREFTVNDAYSLDVDEVGLDRRYRAQHDAYVTIFNRLALPVTVVASDAGATGGSLAHGFMYLTPIGEDTLVLCDQCGYAANRRIAGVRKPEPAQAEPLPISKVATPGTTTIETLATFLHVPASGTAKALFMATERRQADGTVVVEPIVAIVRGDMEGNETKLANAIGAVELRPMTEDEITKIGAVAGYGSPIGVSGATVVVDDLVAASTNLVAGANEAGQHYLNTNHGRDYTADVVADITAARDGDACEVCGSPVRTARGVEVGHTVKLGTVGATYLDAEGRQRPVVMGSYGIGVGRALACVAEEHRDERGLRLPVTVAPYQVHLCRLGGANAEESGAVADRLYDELRRRDVEVLYDDRGERAGVQFADADLIGLPLRTTVGGRALAQGCVEVKRRDADSAELLAVDGAVEQILAQLQALYAEAVAVCVTPNPVGAAAVPPRV